MLIIGSRAAKYWYSDFRNPNKDWDIITTLPELLDWQNQNKRIIIELIPRQCGTKYKCHLKNGTKIEFEIAEAYPSSQELLSIYKADTGDLKYAEPHHLLLIKKSHIHLPIHWWKNITDYHWLKNRIGELRTEDKPLWRKRKREIDARHKRGSFKFNVSNEEFFGRSMKAVGRIYVHDDIHQAVAFEEAPLYQSIKTDPSLAACSDGLFREMAHSRKIKTIQEEMIVIALERKIIPAIEADEEYDLEKAIRWAVARVSTTLMKGAFRRFALENHPEILSSFPRDFVEKFYSAVQEGSVRKQGVN